jgi:4-amino-4-deoxy-L-arabinose transferase-like glycosyltransferase
VTAALTRVSRRFLAGLGGAAALGLAIRLVEALHEKWNSRGGVSDAVYFQLQGRALAEGYFFIDPYRYYGLHQGLHASAVHPPLFSIFLAIPALLGFSTYREAIIGGVLLGTATVVVVGLAGRAIAGDRVGIVAALLAAVYANLWINDAIVTSESITALMVALVALLAYRLWRKHSFGNAAWFGLACGLATLTRAEVALVLPVVAVPLALNLRGLDLAARVKRLGVIVIVAALPVLPWVGYNLARFERPVVLDTGTDFTLANTNCNLTYYGSRLGWWDFRCDRYRTRALNYIEAHESRVPFVLAARLGRLTGLYAVGQTVRLDSVEQNRGPEWITWLAEIQWYVLTVLAVVGLVFLRKTKIIIYPLLGLIAIGLLSGILSSGQTRYRVAAEVPVVLAAAVAVVALFDRWRPAGQERRAPDTSAGRAPTAAA